MLKCSIVQDKFKILKLCLTLLGFEPLAFLAVKQSLSTQDDFMIILFNPLGVHP